MTPSDPARCAVIGHPVDHSLSPEVHLAFAEQKGLQLEYERLATDSADEKAFAAAATEFFAAGGLGLNITLPFKELALRLAAQASERAQEAGAANTIWHRDGALWADNTDGEGLLADLRRCGMEVKGQVVLVLGAGGAARGIVPALAREEPRLLVVANRTMARAMTLVERFGDLLPDGLIATADATLPAKHYDLAINATSLGQTEEAAQLPPLLQLALDRSDAVYDLAYGEAATFARAATEQGLKAEDGLGMLVCQAAAAFELWHGAAPDVGPVIELLRQGR